MSIRDGSKRASSKSRKRKLPEPYDVPEADIRAFVGSLGIHDIDFFAARLQSVADVTNGAFVNQIEELNRSDLRLIKRIARDSDNQHYRQIFTQVLSLVTKGSHGINAAHLIAKCAVEFAFKWTPEYVSALDRYRDKLRETPRRSRALSQRTPRR